MTLSRRMFLGGAALAAHVVPGDRAEGPTEEHGRARCASPDWVSLASSQPRGGQMRVGTIRVLGVLAVLGLAMALSVTVGATVGEAQEQGCDESQGASEANGCCYLGSGSVETASCCDERPAPSAPAASGERAQPKDDCEPPIVGPPPVQPPLFCDGLLVTVNLALGQTPTQGNDVIAGTPGPDFVGALGGNDTICTLGGVDFVTGGPGADTMFGSLGNDFMAGNGGNDTMGGLSGNDTMNGGAGDDEMDGGSGDDTCNGNGGTDTATDCQTTTNVP